MDKKKITRIMFSKPTVSALKRVAAYARVSGGKDAMLQSLSAQVSYYSNMIQSHPEWLYAGVYADKMLLKMIQRYTENRAKAASGEYYSVI